MKKIIIILLMFPLLVGKAIGQKLELSIQRITANDSVNKNYWTLFATSGTKLDTITACDSIIAYKVSGDTVIGVLSLDWFRGYGYECFVKRDNRWELVKMWQWNDRLSGIYPPFTHAELEDAFTVKIDVHELSIKRYKMKSFRKKYDISTNTSRTIIIEE